jgi:glutamine synthetase
MSVFLGDELTGIVDRILSGKGGGTRKAGLLGLGTQVLPPLPRHAGDRNRTSPFAFTGNKFEFRAVGSSQSVSFPITVLNTIVAESIQFMTAMVQARLKKRSTIDAALLDTLKEVLGQHRRIIFDGDGYSGKWHKEAEKRGLLNLKTTLDAVETVLSKKNVTLFEKLHVLSERELEARQEIMLDQYFKTVNIEGETMEWIAQTQILPGVVSYLGELGGTAHAFPGSSALKRTSAEVAAALDTMADRLEVLRAANAELGGEDIHSKARHMRNTVIPAMVELREAADALERIVSYEVWPLPSYRDMLFVK